MKRDGPKEQKEVLDIYKVPEVWKITESLCGHVKQNFLDCHKLQMIFSKCFHQLTLRVKCHSQEEPEEKEEEDKEFS